MEKLNILLVDDDETIRKYLGKTLREDYSKVYCAKDAKEAIEIYFNVTESIDLILSDFVMPLKSGLELFKELKEQGSKTPFYIISAYVGEDEEKRFMEKGIKRVFRKTLDYGELVGKINSDFGFSIKTETNI